MSIYIEDKNGKRRKFAGVGSEKDYIDDGIAGEKMTWSSEKILDTLCPPFTETGNPVTCHPVEDYLLSAVVSLEPKQAGSGDPSPDNVRAISGYDEVSVNVRGRNLCNPEEIEDGILNSAGGVNPSQDYKTTGFIRVFAGARISHTQTGAYGNYFYNAEKQFISNISSSTGVDITVPDNAVYLRFSATNDTTEVMVNFGEALLPYEPYQPGTTAQLSFPETIYGGTVDAVTGVGSKEWFTAILTGNETWTSWGSDRLNSFFIDIEGHKNLANNAINVICNNFSYDNGDDRYMPYHFFSQNPGLLPDNVRLCFTFDETVTSVDLAKQWIAAQYTAETPVTICYKLATPEPFQATGNRPLSALPGTNTLYTDGNSLTVSGSTSPISAIESFKADVQASANQAEAVANILLGGA